MIKLFVVVFFVPIVLFGQNTDYKPIDLTQFNKELNSFLIKQPRSNFKVSFENKTYSTPEKKVLISGIKGEYSIGTGNYACYFMDNQRYFQNNELAILVDTSQKMVTLCDLRDFQELFANMNIELKDSTQYAAFVKRNTKTTTFSFEEQSQLSQTKRTELEYSSITFNLQRINIQLWEDNYYSQSLNDETLETPLIEYVYQKPIFSEKINQEIDIELARIGKMTNDQFVPNSLYSNFRIEDIRSNLKSSK